MLNWTILSLSWFIFLRESLSWFIGKSTKTLLYEQSEVLRFATLQHGIYANVPFTDSPHADYGLRFDQGHFGEEV